MKIKNRSHETVNNHIKHLANSISATFVYAGINVEGSGLLAEGNSVEKAMFSQTAHRFKKFDLHPFRYNDPQSRKDFFKVLASFENHLLLFNQQPETLVRNRAEYIWERTGGCIGPISTLIREGAAVAIKCQAECITEDILGGIKLDFESEQLFKLSKKQKQASGQRSVT